MGAWEGLYLLYPLAGFLVGILIGMTGMGGGSLMTPLLIMLFGVPPTVAVGTDLLYASATKSGGTIAHRIANTIEWKIVGRLALGSIPGAVLVLWWLSSTRLESEEIGSVITVLLGCTLLLTAVSLLLRAHLRGISFSFSGTPDSRYQFLAIVFIGFVLGILVSLTSVGAGALGVVVLIMLYPNLPMSRIVGSDIAHAVPLTLIGGIGHWYLGSVHWGFLFALLIGSIPGVFIGSFAAARVPETAIRVALAVILAMVSLRLLFAS